MTEQHPITPPPELVKQWTIEHWRMSVKFTDETTRQYVATQTAKWCHEQHASDIEDQLQKARDEELEACCEWLADETPTNYINALRTARRPKPPSQAEEAMEAFCSMQIKPAIIGGINVNKEVMDKYDIIRRALERLKELEGQGDG